MAWEPPRSVEVLHHFHYVSGGGVLIVETESPSAMYESIAPFRPMIEVDIEPVINIIEALAISADIDEWLTSLESHVPT